MFIDIEKILDEKNTITSWSITKEEDESKWSYICINISDNKYYFIRIYTDYNWDDNDNKYQYQKIEIWQDEELVEYHINKNLDPKTFEKVENIEKLIQKRIIKHIQNKHALV